MHRNIRWQTALPHHWPVRRSGTHIPAAPIRNVVVGTETPPAATDGGEDGLLAALPWIGLYYETESH